jgi:hypothetical protein
MKSFEQQLREMEKQFEDQVRKTIQDASVDMFNQIIEDSPIKSGAFVGGYGIDNGEFNGQPNSKGSKQRQIEIDTRRKDPLKEDIVFENDAPYAERLEFGYSAQAPEGMIRKNVMQWDKYLTEAAKRNFE